MRRLSRKARGTGEISRISQNDTDAGERSHGKEDELAERNRLNEVLLKLATGLVDSGESENVLQKLCNALVAASTRILLAWIWFGPENTRVIQPQIMAGPAADYAKTLSIRRAWLTKSGPVLRALGGEVYVRMGISRYSLYGPWRRAAMRFGFGESVAIRLDPLPGDEKVGVVVFYADSHGYFESVGIDPFMSFVALSRSVLHQCQITKMLRDQALSDPLTGLPNRRAFLDHLHRNQETTLRYGRQLGIVILDLDGFKGVNDRLGHVAGDHVLQQAAQRIRGCLRPEDILVRLGGDEFALLLPGLRGREGVEKPCDRIISSLRLPILWEDTQLNLTASMGVTIFPQDDSSGELLLRHADEALYSAKLLGRDQYQWYTSELKEKQIQMARKQVALLQAVEEGRVELWYQPILELGRGSRKSTKIWGWEALMRVRQVHGDLLTPAAFMEVMDDQRVAPKLGRHVLLKALQQVSRWVCEGHSFHVCVNISPQYLLDSTFLPDLVELLAAHSELSPEHLEIEVTETAPLKDFSHAKKVLESVRELGVSVALDDFGTGNSSMRYLQQFPANTIKIDQSFTRDLIDDPRDLAVVVGTINAGQMLGLRVIAEGVETASKAEFLAKLGCWCLQGYWIAMPMPAEEVIPWVKTDEALPQFEVKEVMREEVLWGHHFRVRQLLSALEGKEPFPENVLEVGAEHNCNLGVWLRLIQDKFCEHPEWATINAQHEEIHRLSRAAKSAWNAGHQDEVSHLRACIVQCNDDLLGRLQFLANGSCELKL